MKGFDYLILQTIFALPALILLIVFRRIVLAHLRVIIVLILFCLLDGTIWDSLIFGRVYTFAPRILTGIKLGYLPVEEYLLFMNVPFVIGVITIIAMEKTNGSR
jgi:lycopene cyclase domain-containing protein